MIGRKLMKSTAMAGALFALGIGLATEISAGPTVYPTGVTRYDPDQAYNGFALVNTVTNYGASEDIGESIPVRLIDMNGNTVHSWDVNSWQRSRLLPNCNLMIIEEGEKAGVNFLVEYDWEGNEVWRWRPDVEGVGGRLSAKQSHMLHHDFDVLPNGEILGMYSIPVPEEKLAEVEDFESQYFGKIKRKGVPLIGDELFYVNRDGEITWKVALHDHIDVNEFPPAWKRLIDWTHANAIRAVPENKWYDQGDERFKPGNVIVNTRNMPEVRIFDRDTKEIVWSFKHNYLGGFAGQHEPYMIPKGYPGEGNILVFDNGAHSPDEDHIGKSLVLEIDPIQKRIVWKYEAKGRALCFFNRSRSAAQRLPNGNTLISADNKGRLFQVRPDKDHMDGGEIVWEFVVFNTDEHPLWATARSNMYPYDFCPKMAELPRSQMRVTPPKPSEWQIAPDELRKK